MQTFKNNTGGVTLTQFERDARKWKETPVQEIKFIMPKPLAATLETGDRINTGLERCEIGLKSGSIVDVHLVIENIETRQHIIGDECSIDVVAMAKRIES